MRRIFVLVCLPLALAASLGVAAPVAASGGFFYTVITDSCTGPNGWTSVFKVKEAVYDYTGANRLTIDSKAQWHFTNGRQWHTSHTWARRSNSYAPNGTEHFLTLQRSYAGGNVEEFGRIVFTLRAWHNSSLLWTQTVKSTPC